MEVFNPTNLYSEITIFLRNWIELLSRGKFDEACSLLDIPKDKKKNIVWEKEALMEVFWTIVGMKECL